MSRGSSLGHLGVPSNIHNIGTRNQVSYTGRSNVSSNNGFKNMGIDPCAPLVV